MEAYFPQNSTYGPHRMASSENGSCVFFSTDQIILIDLKPYLEHCQRKCNISLEYRNEVLEKFSTVPYRSG